jgi:ribonuclease R
MKNPLNLETAVLELVYSDDYQPLKLRGIAKRLKLLDDEKNLKRAVKRLIKQDRLAYGPKHLIIKPAKNASAKKKSPAQTQSAFQSKTSGVVPKTLKTSERSSEVIGTFRRANAGFGFVTPQLSTATDRSDDIFIPKQKTLDAADLDLVRIRLSRGHGGKPKKDAKGPSGRVIEVLERHTNRFVGTYIERGGFGFVLVDGDVFESGILVGDAGAKNGKVDDKVVIEMVRFPSDREEGEGVIVEILGDRGKPGVDTLSIIRQFDLPEEFPESVMENAREQAAAFDDDAIPAGRTDFTKKTIATIDPKTARDFDDAISLERLENGHWELGVHIADVSHFVPYRSDLDNEAYQRGTSVYLPDRVIPMLPEIISNNLASLQPNRNRFSMTAVIEFSDAGVPINTELHRGVINSAHRFNYEEIDDYLANDQPWKEKLTPAVFQLVRDMHTLAMKLRKRRMDGGSINLVLPEIRIDLDDDGKVCGAHTVENTESHQVIEEFMLAANEAVAQRLVDEKLFLMRRVHPQPTETKLKDLNNFVKGLGIECENLEDRFELKRVIEESEGMTEQHAIHYAVLRSMQKAIYSPEEIGHYALNSKTYCHFTSPIRRYPDLIIHRMVGDLVDGKRPKSNFDRLVALGKHCSDLEKRATEAERELTKLKLLNFMSSKIGEKLHAVITGVEAFGIFAQGIEIPAEGMLPVANLPDDTYQYDRASRTLSGFKRDNQYRLGDEIEVRVAIVDPDRRILEFELVGVKPSPQNVTRRSHPPGKSQRSARTKSKRSASGTQPASVAKPASGSNPKKPQRVSTPQDPNSWEAQRASGRQQGHNRKKKPKEQPTTSSKTGNKPGHKKTAARNSNVKSIRSKDAKPQPKVSGQSKSSKSSSTPPKSKSAKTKKSKSRKPKPKK